MRLVPCRDARHGSAQRVVSAESAYLSLTCLCVAFRLEAHVSCPVAIVDASWARRARHDVESAADGGVIKAAWSVLQHTCKNQPPHRRMVAGGGGLELLVKALVDFAADASVFRVLLGAANQLCTKDERNKVMINGLGGTASILAALESFGSDEAMVAALLETLTWLMCFLIMN